MKRLLISLAAAAVLLPAVAQTTNPNAKVDPKNNKVANPVVEKPKAKPQLNRDQLRDCMDRSDANAKEAEAIKVLQSNYKTHAAALQEEKDGIQKQDEANAAALTAAKAEKATIEKSYEDLKAEAPKLKKEELDVKNKEYQDRVAAFDKTVTTVNDAIKALGARREVFGTKVDGLNAEYKTMDERTEAHLDNVDAWKNECSRKTFDEADEAAIKKERAAAGK
ncbi:hypothetical protein SNE35_19170 [Paucibacter sp. R3-3]|uniref:Uncharacterized protein n=1 Tax=Roseateles agri TaxID=3098619 RepID=A0ABU5DK32_9BURK|nr:hypothetical protein [Paucibacter sp. R3-3]MDY0746642.1 hypothetical protein [Paucibacter sp. R3-3]